MHHRRGIPLAAGESGAAPHCSHPAPCPHAKPSPTARAAAFLLFLAAAWLSFGAPGPTPAIAGHWEGSIQLPTAALDIKVDLEQTPDGSWSGTIDIPAQGLRGFKLGDVTVRGLAVSFKMPGVPGEPGFAGDLDRAASRIRGQFTQGGQKFPFSLERKQKASSTGETPSRGVPGKGLAGHWQGSLKPTPVIELRLVLELTNAPAGKAGVDGVMISLDQGGVKIPITSLTHENATVRFEAASVGGSFNGQLKADGSELAGDWKQGPSSLPVTFKRLEKPPVITRPQDPVKPYPYNEEEVSVPTKSAEVSLAGTLTSPRSPGPHPAVILITGSGPQDRDEAIMGHRPFLVLADHLTRRGIAVLRCDDRGIGKSTGRFDRATHRDFVDDTVAQVTFLRSRKHGGPIGLIGHSEGGIVAPLAAVRSKEVAFIVLLAGVGVPIENLLEQQARDIARVVGAGEDTITRSAELQRQMFQVVREEKDPARVKEKLREMAKHQVASLTDEEKAALNVSDNMIEAQLATVTSPWFRELLAYDPRPTLEAVKCPMLALNGEKDLQVSAKENLAAIRDALTAGGNSRFETLELPGLNHLFQACRTGAVTEYAAIEETFNPAALAAISDWILTTTKTP